jgi:exodeoxyribonuclease-3
LGKTQGRNGVAIFTSEKPKRKNNMIGYDKFDSEGRFIELEFGDYSIINVYMPHGSRDKSRLPYKLAAFEKLTEYLKNRQRDKFVLLGDFNVALTELDALNAKRNENNTMFTIEERTAMKRIFDIGIIDCFRNLYPAESKYTWWPYAYDARERNVGWRIDYIMVNDSVSKDKYTVQIRDDIYGSDHCPVSLDINW